MRLLVLHQKFPGQFGHLGKAWSQRPGWEVRALGRDSAPGLPRFDKLLRRNLARALLLMEQQGFTPDAGLARPGWGASLYVKIVHPDARLVYHCGLYCQPESAGLNVDPEFSLIGDDRVRATVTTSSGLTLKAGDPVATDMTRNLEPHRGLHIFMPALEKLRQWHKTVHALIVGEDRVSDGNRPKNAKNWRDRTLGAVKLDPIRPHLLGRVPRAQCVHVLQVSRSSNLHLIPIFARLRCVAQARDAVCVPN